MEICFGLGQPGHNLSAIESRQLSWPPPSWDSGCWTEWLCHLCTQERGEAAGPKPMVYTFPFVPGLLALPVGVGDIDVCTLGAGADLWALTPCDQEAVCKAALPEVTS